MKVWVFTFVILALPRMGLAADVLTLSYDELGDLIRKNNKSIQSASQVEASARQRVGHLNNSFLPKASLEAGIAEQREANGESDAAPFWRVDVQANIYRGGRDELGVLLRESQVLIREVDTQTQFRAELFKAKLDYIHLDSVRRAIQLTEASTDDYDGIRRSILRKAQAGLMTTTGAQALQLEVDELKRQVKVLRKEEDELVDRLLLVLGLEAHQAIVLSSPHRTIELSKPKNVVKDNIRNLPEIKKYELLAQSVTIESNARQEWWVPDVSLFAAYTGFRVEDSNEFRTLPDRELSLGVRFSIDLEAKRSFDNETIARRSEAASYSSQKDYLLRELEHKIHEYQREMAVHAELSTTLKQSAGRAEKLLRQLRDEFERGIGSNSEITGLIRTLYKLKRDEMDSAMSYNLARAGLETLNSL